MCRELLVPAKIHLFWMLTVTAPLIARANPAEVQFDMPPVVSATSDSDPQEVTIGLRLSAMINTVETPPISQWIVRVVPRDEQIQVVDYFPRTETASDVATPIKITQTDESTQSAGVSVDGAYANLARANLGADRGNKQIDTIQFDRQPPQQTVTAAGTIQRGRGVYFKLRWTANQVLEGEKRFEVTMRVPARWRGGLFDVSVVAHGEAPSDPGWSPRLWQSDSRTIGEAKFVIAAYRQGDSAARQAAYGMSEAERELRRLGQQNSIRPTPSSLPEMIRQVAAKLELESSRANDQWLQRVLFASADPHLDKSIRKLPMPIRIAVLEYTEQREQFRAMSAADAGRVVAAKPPLSNTD